MNPFAQAKAFTFDGPAVKIQECVSFPYHTIGEVLSMYSSIPPTNAHNAMLNNK
jgi:hypothetical protein